MKLYEKFADDIERLIRQGVYRHGERLPSVRQASQQHRISITTVLHAYLLLESRGLLASRPQSGYFVNLERADGERQMQDLRASKPIAVSSTVDVSRLVLSTLRSIGSGDAVPLGSPYPDPVLFPFEKLNRYAYTAGRDKTLWSLTNALPPGDPRLLRQIARRHLENGMPVDPNEIIVTVGATEAINLCLQAVAKPGDVIAVESPTFYAMLHAIERMGMKAIEVSTHPEHGIDIGELAAIVKSQPIAACMVMPNFQNPLGFQMPDERKRELVEFLAAADIPVIENAVYNELYFGDAHPSSLKSYDRKGLVLHCSSFSKSLTATYRIGWALPGRYRDQVEKLKFLNTLATPLVPQLAIAEYLERDGYEHHLRRIRKAYAQQANLMRAMVSRFFPEGTRISSPAGGYVLWVELPAKVDAMHLYQLALERGITIGPGYMFSISGSYRNFIRLNYSSPWSRRIEEAVIEVGKLVASCAR
ncbi:2-aminoadipate aminotransferase [Cupriavidus sp. USMAA2-4]|uniref:2-aminoadipate aminotransferase n=1 Tax=Cupriavidus malaysiensis TaxID=367825 RepID=A0A1D9IE62_9BURK|nr:MULTISPECIES: PLP-dependent aminotransferase family protein [Cupriavidus]AOY94865.1 2-aminoadipate aminotransferase [Cupriavidus sp. USMAA2-4]AOZ02274.1 2-aminoadipate aminotransferase [Cupriavidus sp. USMAHM13]AOZ10348.1 2-aminoadipate aminotransferase [Cupriavidus malaysiensis]